MQCELQEGIPIFTLLVHSSENNNNFSSSYVQLVRLTINKLTYNLAPFGIFRFGFDMHSLSTECLLCKVLPICWFQCKAIHDNDRDHFCSKIPSPRESSCGTGNEPLQGKPCNHQTLIHMVTCMQQQYEILPGPRSSEIHSKVQHIMMHRRVHHQNY